MIRHRSSCCLWCSTWKEPPAALGLGGADRPDPDRLAGLAARAELLGAPLVSEHIAFVRAGGPLTASPRLEAGHLLPVPRTRDALDVLCENVRIAQDSLPVPLALENIAALITWPDEELAEGQFLAELVERTGVRLLMRTSANLHTNHVNLGQDPAKALDELPVEAIAYVAGGVENGVWHDTHTHPVSEPVLEVLAELRSRVDPPGVLLERDDALPPGAELAGELGRDPGRRCGRRHPRRARGRTGRRAGVAPAADAAGVETPRSRPHLPPHPSASVTVPPSHRPPCSPPSSPEPRPPRASTTGGCGCRAGHWRPSAPTSSPRWHPNCRRSSATATAPRSSRTPAAAPCPAAIAATPWTSRSMCSSRAVPPIRWRGAG
ncbi:hypothetical protein SBADM41S_10907 [Streptomyces badius]